MNDALPVVNPLGTAIILLGLTEGAVAVATYFCLANAGRIAARLGPSGMSMLTKLKAATAGSRHW